MFQGDSICYPDECDYRSIVKSSNHVFMSTCTSLEFQLNYVAPDDSLGTACEAAPCIIFPNLPTVIRSDSLLSRATTTSADKSNKASLSKETTDDGTSSSDDCQKGERYGWFVILDDDICEPRTGFSAYKSVTADLASSALTAPISRGQEEQAELEWAQAADIVDDILGDLF